MPMEKEDLTRFSTDIAQVMDDIGVNETMVSLRRHFSCVMDRRMAISADANGRLHFYTFGSQSEGSTTIGMHSDYDRLAYNDLEVACVQFADFQDSKQNYFVIKETMSLSQCCCLQVVERLEKNRYSLIDFRDFISDTESIRDRFIVDHKGRVLFNSMCHVNFFLHEEFTNWPILKRQHGPALTYHDIDEVVAIHCMTLPDNCRVLFTRPRPGHWPTQETLTQAEQCEMYMVHPGVLWHTFGYDHERRCSVMNVQYQNKYIDSQFRMSTNMIERLLMFDLNIVQMKAYVITKMLRKEFLQPLVDERLSTFHMKTAFLFTVELFPEGIWRDDNILQCVIYCLTILKRFMKKRYCPHYTIGSVDLFAGKMKVNELQIVKDIVTEMINSGLSCLRTLDMDHVGKRLSTSVVKLNHHMILSGTEIHFQIIKTMITKLDYSHFDQTVADLKYLKRLVSGFYSALATEHECRAELEFIFQSLCCTLASQEASECIANGKEVTTDIINMYETSLGSKAVVNHLRYASMLVCTHQFECAARVLNKIATAITLDAIDESYVLKQCKDVKLTSNEGHYKCTPSETLMFFAGICVLPLVFMRNEINCVPSHIVYEKFATISEDESKSAHVSGRCFMHVFESGVRPFFYYLQYLSSTNEENKRQALANLSNYCDSELKHKTSDYLDTELNMLGHIHELENNLPDAWIIYRKSVTIRPRYNAAYWHLFRLFGKVIYCKF